MTRVVNAIGSLALHWAYINGIIHDLSLHIAAALNPAFENPDEAPPRPWDIMNTALSNMDERAKIATVKALAHHVDETRSPQFYERTAKLLDYVDNTLRPERNRWMHDHWEFGDVISRVKLGAQVRRPQSRQRELQLWSERQYESVEEVEAFITNLEHASDDLVALDNHIAWIAGLRDGPSTFEQPLPVEWASIAHKDWVGGFKRS
ncbi:hypothetical protein [Phenylobacterium sp.]|uniref:hypothetical protein n=1 Tax=Phenylobacterium sp. TaxID=1871053 RepID=UPI00271983F5|nr:hypothetical protein [Phenylobacterium sp.]MDO8378597.1 hypothetical protein [Phenylobacterium sp.]